MFEIGLTFSNLCRSNFFGIKVLFLPHMTFSKFLVVLHTRTGTWNQFNLKLSFKFANFGVVLHIGTGTRDELELMVMELIPRSDEN